MLGKGVVLSTVAVITAVYFTNVFRAPAKLPKLKDEWWGPKKDLDEEIRRSEIAVENEVLEDLRDRLQLRLRTTETLDGAAFSYGISNSAISSIHDYWLKEYNWKKQEELLNRIPHFETQIEGLNIHFQRLTPKSMDGVKVLPLLMLHGWPGSIVEFQKIMPILTKPRNGVAFDVIVPCLPGYGWSEAAVKPGLGPAEIGQVMVKLMKRLGFEKFFLQGGDWGAIISSNIAAFFPDNLFAVHLNMANVYTPTVALKLLVGSLFPSLVVDKEHTHLFFPLSEKMSILLRESGYLHIQATKPDTVGVGLANSPIGLAAYILEKFSTGTNRSWMYRDDGGLTEKFTMDELLTNVMVYWVTNSMTTAARLYREKFSDLSKNSIDGIPCYVPTGVAVFPNEAFLQPESVLKERFKNIIRFKYMQRGGHFAAFEEPELLANEIFETFSQIQI